MILSAWRLSCVALLATLVACEVLLPVLFVRAPFIEVGVLTLASLLYAHFGAQERRYDVRRVGVKESRSKKSVTQSASEKVAALAKQEKPPAPKQLVLPESALAFERHVTRYLLQHLGRTNFHHESFSLQDMNQLMSQPESWMRIDLWPVVTFPQRKLLRHRVCLQLKINNEFRSSPSLGGVADLLLCLQTMHVLQQHVQEPLMMDFPMSTLAYPKLVQHLFDCLEKKDSSFHHVLWLVSDMNERHRVVWQRLQELGLTFAECLVAPQMNITSPYAHMTWDAFEKYSSMEEYRSMPTSMRRFVSQSTHIILGDVPENANITMPFDSIYGPFSGLPYSLGGVESGRLSA